jgi:hypothetical protein
MRRALTVAMLGLVCAAAVQAQISQIDERLIPLAQCPVQVTNIQAGWPAPEWASEAQKKVNLPFDVLPLYVQVQNMGQKQIYGYRLLIAAYDAFGDYIDSARATAITALAPQVADYGRWSLRIKQPQVVQTVVVFVDAIRFQDGTAWRVDPASVCLLVPSTAPAARFQSWHIMPEAHEVLLQFLKDPE